MVRKRRLPTAWFSHGLLGIADQRDSTVMTDEQIDEIGRRFTAAMAELMEFAGEFLAGRVRRRAAASPCGCRRR